MNPTKEKYIFEIDEMDREKLEEILKILQAYPKPMNGLAVDTEENSLTIKVVEKDIPILTVHAPIEGAKSMISTYLRMTGGNNASE